MSTVNPVPESLSRISPYLTIDGAAEAMEFYKKAFDAEELMRMPMPNGKLMHGCMRIFEATVMMSDENEAAGVVGPKKLGGSTVAMHVFVEDVDKSFQQAIDAGATVAMPVADMFWGDRFGCLEDPFGHRWSLATHKKDLSPEEMMAAVNQAIAEDCGV